MKLQRAPGVDNVMVSMLKYAGPSFVVMLTEVINKKLSGGQSDRIFVSLKNATD